MPSPPQVVAIVTDRLTDCAVIADLHAAASRGAAVYVILNQRSVQENFTVKKLRHPVSEPVRLESGWVHLRPASQLLASSQTPPPPLHREARLLFRWNVRGLHSTARL